MSQVYMSSRWTQGNLLFPDTLSVEPDGVHYVKRRLLGSDEEVINYAQIASVQVKSGILFANIRIETAGGSQPVVMNGLAKNNAKAIQQSIQQLQATQRTTR